MFSSLMPICIYVDFIHYFAVLFDIKGVYVILLLASFTYFSCTYICTELAALFASWHEGQYVSQYRIFFKSKAGKPQNTSLLR